MRLFLLIRHAVAEDREEWSGPDHERPLTKKGRRQAAGLAEMIPILLQEQSAPVPIGLRTSPYVRCVQTIEPLAAALELEAVIDPTLGEGRAIPLPRSKGTHLLCAHGDNIPGLLDGLGVSWSECKKGSVWMLRLGEGEAVAASKYLRPPAG